MSKSEIIEQLPRLSREERQEIRLKLAELDPDDWIAESLPLSLEDEALVEARMAGHRSAPETSIPLDEMKRRLRS